MDEGVPNSINFVLLLNLWRPEHEDCSVAVFEQFCFSALGWNMTLTLMSPCKLLSTCRKQEKGKKETWDIHRHDKRNYNSIHCVVPQIGKCIILNSNFTKNPTRKMDSKKKQ